VTSPSRGHTSWRRPAAGLVTVVALVVVGLVAALGVDASGPQTATLHNVVALVDHAGGQRVGVHELVLPGQRRARAPNYDGCATGSCVAAETEGAEAAATRTFQTYTKVNAETGEVYAGRTSGYGTPLENLASRDVGHAYNDVGFGPAQLDQSSESYAAIRGREQQLIEHYRDLGISANKINGVSPANANLDWYLGSALEQFGAVP
jgi:hypothetical protein